MAQLVASVSCVVLGGVVVVVGSNLYTVYWLHAMSHPLKKEVLKVKKRKCLANTNNFSTKINIRHVLSKKMHAHT